MWYRTIGSTNYLVFLIGVPTSEAKEILLQAFFEIEWHSWSESGNQLRVGRKNRLLRGLSRSQGLCTDEALVRLSVADGDTTLATMELAVEKRFLKKMGETNQAITSSVINSILRICSAKRIPIRIGYRDVQHYLSESDSGVKYPSVPIRWLDEAGD